MVIQVICRYLFSKLPGDLFRYHEHVVRINSYTCLNLFTWSGLIHSFAIHTSVPLVIEWFFNSLSLAIETRYQKIAVKATWRKQLKSHILMAIVCVLPVAIWTSGNLLVMVHRWFNDPLTQCFKMLFIHTAGTLREAVFLYTTIEKKKNCY